MTTAALRAPGARLAAPLRVPNFRRWFIGQLVSICGTWTQTVAEMWLVLSITGSGFALGMVTALQFLPILILGAPLGVIVDRVSRRRLLAVTQALLIVPAATMALLSASGHANLWAVYSLVLARGLVTAIDQPARQAFLAELVGPDRVTSAVSLQSAAVNTARIVGPAIAGVLIATVGVTACFAVNAASFAACLVALALIDGSQLLRRRPVVRGRGQVREGLRFAWRTPEVRRPLIMLAVVSTFTFNFPVVLPVLAREFGGGAGTYALLTASMGAGAIVGALWMAGHGRSTPSLLIRSAIAFGGLVVAAAMVPQLDLAVALLAGAGAASIVFLSGVNGAIQLAVDDALRGRVMAIYGVVFLGSTPLGGPVVGLVAQLADARVALAIGGIAAVLTGIVAYVTSTASSRRTSTSRSTPSTRTTSAS